ncbi:MAG: Palmitoyltransferase zdhhc17 [Piccolia ochrophora]|nr:MAG: Palmitoyltransferase zdhhc17 [Piccolia ochrophora]
MTTSIQTAEPVSSMVTPSLPTSSRANTAGGTTEDGKSNDDVELKTIPAETRTIPLEEDIMQLARLGEVGAIQKLFDTGKFDVKYKDDEGITPLHWAAINNQYALCKYLIEAGSDINAKGGESVATPIMWATQRGHYYVVNLFLQYGADTLVTDIQGYNALHLATFDGNVFLLVLLLHQNVPVDIPGPHGHTCLMWAAYKGYPACVDLFLRWGADVHAVDETGFTALHWGLVKGSLGCIQKLIEYGSDRFAQSTTGKTPALTADEMKSTRIWHRALSQCGYDENGNLHTANLPSFVRGKVFMSRFFFLWPVVIIWAVLFILSNVVIYAAVPLAAVAGYGMQVVAQQALRWAPPDMNHMHRTPFLAGVFAGTLFLIAAAWVTRILPWTGSSHPFMNTFFGLCLGFCAYFYYCCMANDPGYVPKMAGLTQQKAVIEQLLNLWKFDDQNFCVPCMCNILSDAICEVVLRDPFTTTLTLWTVLNLSWITMLLTVQLVQVARAQTTFENMRAHSHPEHEYKALEAVESALAAGTTSLEDAQLTADGMGPNPALAQTPQHQRNQRQGWFAYWKKLLGLDTFVVTARGGLESHRAQRTRNPFSRGMITNCTDFWLDPSPVLRKKETGSALLGGERINYANMYETPPRLRLREARGETEGGAYHSIASEDNAV